jgi:hypothetical protein
LLHEAAQRGRPRHRAHADTHHRSAAACAARGTKQTFAHCIASRWAKGIGPHADARTANGEIEPQALRKRSMMLRGDAGIMSVLIARGWELYDFSR